MNEFHLQMLSSPRWAEMLERDLFPWVAAVTDLGDDVLEVGPGPGLTTDLLRQRTSRLTAVEIDPELAIRLVDRLGGTNVTVINRSAADTELPDDRFSAAACFGVLHHVPTAEVQNQIFDEILRVLQPGAPLVASDGYDNEGTRLHHQDDLFVPLDPEALPARLEDIGYTDIAVDLGEYDFRFIARKPTLELESGEVSKCRCTGGGYLARVPPTCRSATFDKRRRADHQGTSALVICCVSLG